MRRLLGGWVAELAVLLFELSLRLWPLDGPTEEQDVRIREGVRRRIGA